MWGGLHPQLGGFLFVQCQEHSLGMSGIQAAPCFGEAGLEVRVLGPDFACPSRATAAAKHPHSPAAVLPLLHLRPAGQRLLQPTAPCSLRPQPWAFLASFLQGAVKSPAPGTPCHREARDLPVPGLQ